MTKIYILHGWTYSLEKWEKFAVLLKKSGFEPVFFVSQIVNFLILAFIFKKFLYKPVLKILQDRKRQIAKGIEDAEAAGIALVRANSEKDELIKTATLEAERIIEKARMLRPNPNEVFSGQSMGQIKQLDANSAMQFLQHNVYNIT